MKLWAMQTSSWGIERGEMPGPQAMAKAVRVPSTLRPPQTRRSDRSQLSHFKVGRTVSQLQPLRTRDWFVRPSPALSPLVSLSLPFHICAHQIYWCLCSRTDSDSFLFLLFWSPFSRGSWRPSPSHCVVLLS